VRVIGYLDAGSGSMIASAIAAGAAGFIMVFKVGAGRVFGMFSPKRRREMAAAKAAAVTEEKQ
jgi:hypothetical protein